MNNKDQIMFGDLVSLSWTDTVGIVIEIKNSFSHRVRVRWFDEEDGKPIEAWYNEWQLRKIYE